MRGRGDQTVNDGAEAEKYGQCTPPVECTGCFGFAAFRKVANRDPQSGYRENRIDQENRTPG